MEKIKSRPRDSHLLRIFLLASCIPLAALSPARAASATAPERQRAEKNSVILGKVKQLLKKKMCRAALADGKRSFVRESGMHAQSELAGLLARAEECLGDYAMKKNDYVAARKHYGESLSYSTEGSEVTEKYAAAREKDEGSVESIDIKNPQPRETARPSEDQGRNALQSHLQGAAAVTGFTKTNGVMDGVRYTMFYSAELGGLIGSVKGKRIVQQGRIQFVKSERGWIPEQVIVEGARY